MPALLFGSISTIADTSELQRDAFNEAFAEHGLDWRWEADEYRTLLEKSGGRDRIAEHATAIGVEVDADAVHRTKSEIFRRKLAATPLTPRPGVSETLAAAREKGYKVAFVTTTTPENVAAVLAGTDGVDDGDFDLILDLTSVEQPKPDKAVYVRALEALGQQPDDCVAVEDNLGGVEAAKAAGVECIAFPNANTAGHDFARADRVVERLSLAAA